jgi:hypothetical protein
VCVCVSVSNRVVRVSLSACVCADMSVYSVCAVSLTASMRSSTRAFSVCKSNLRSVCSLNNCFSMSVCKVSSACLCVCADCVRLVCVCSCKSVSACVCAVIRWVSVSVMLVCSCVDKSASVCVWVVLSVWMSVCSWVRVCGSVWVRVCVSVCMSVRSPDAFCAATNSTTLTLSACMCAVIFPLTASSNACVCVCTPSSSSVCRVCVCVWSVCRVCVRAANCVFTVSCVCVNVCSSVCTLLLRLMSAPTDFDAELTATSICLLPKNRSLLMDSSVCERDTPMGCVCVCVFAPGVVCAFALSSHSLRSLFSVFASNVGCFLSNVSDKHR